MSHIIRLTEQLTWKALRDTFFIGTRVVETLARNEKNKVIMVDGDAKTIKSVVFVNELQEAIDAGKLDVLVAEAAELYHGGNIQAVIASLVRNLDSQRTNLKNKNYAFNHKIEEIRLETMVKFVNDRRVAKSRPLGTLPQWAYGPKELDAIDDVNKLQNVINSINDACCNKAHGTYAKFLGEDYIEAAKANREYAKKRKESLLSKANAISPAFMAKLATGTKVTLTKEEVEQLVKLLNK